MAVYNYKYMYESSIGGENCLDEAWKTKPFMFQISVDAFEKKYKVPQNLKITEIDLISEDPQPLLDKVDAVTKIIEDRKRIETYVKSMLQDMFEMRIITGPKDLSEDEFAFKVVKHCLELYNFNNKINTKTLYVEPPDRKAMRHLVNSAVHGNLVGVVGSGYDLYKSKYD